MGIAQSVPVSLYSIRDLKSELYGPVFQADSDPDAIRSFVALMLSPSNLSQFPDDFALFRIGRFERVTGFFDDYEVPRVLMSGLSALALADRFRQAQVKGRAVGETATAVAPEDSPASAGRSGSGSPDDPADLSQSRSYQDTPDMLNSKKIKE